MRMRMCMCVYVFVCVYVCLCVFACVCVCACVRAYMHTCVRACLRACVCVRVCVCVRARARALSLTRACVQGMVPVIVQQLVKGVMEEGPVRVTPSISLTISPGLGASSEDKRQRLCPTEC